MKVLFSYIFTALLIFACTPLHAQVIEGTSGRQIETRRNYIKDGSAEAYTRGFVRYQDAAASEAVDGVGGSPTVALPTVTTSTPLRDKKSFLITKAASNVQGQGYSIPFTIDRSDRAKVLDVEIDYTVPSGTFVAGTPTTDSDLVVQIYDVTNATLIPLSSKKFLYNGSALEDKFRASFQSSSNSVSYRLIIHHATTSSSAFTFEFELGVYPSRYVYGTPVTDWQPYTPTGTWTTNTTYTGRWRRVGQQLEAQVRMNFSGAPTAATLASVSIPSGLSIDTSTNAVSTRVGYGYFQDTTVNSYALGVIIISTTSVTPVFYTASGASAVNSLINNTNVFTVGSGDLLDFYFSVPIVGWSSSVQMSDQADTRVVAASASNSSQVITNATSPILVSSMSTSYDTHGGFNTGTGRYTIQVPGFYRISGISQSTPTYVGGSSFTTLNVFVNGTASGTLQSFQASGASTVNNQYFNGSITLNLKAGDLVDLRYNNQSGNSVTVAASVLQLERLSGPSAIAASESVNARAVNTAGTSISNVGGEVIVPFATEDFDSHGSWSTDTFTVPIAGKYRVSAVVGFTSSTYAAGNQVYASIYKNGVGHSYGPQTFPGANTVAVLVGVGGTVNCVAGDTITIRVLNNRSAGATSLSVSTGVNHVSIERVGN